MIRPGSSQRTRYLGLEVLAKPGSKRRILGAINKTAAGLHRAGVIDKAAMREFDALCRAVIRPSVKLPAEQNE